MDVLLTVNFFRWRLRSKVMSGSEYRTPHNSKHSCIPGLGFSQVLLMGHCDSSSAHRSPRVEFTLHWTHHTALLSHAAATLSVLTTTALHLQGSCTPPTTSWQHHLPRRWQSSVRSQNHTVSRQETSKHWSKLVHRIQPGKTRQAERGRLHGWVAESQSWWRFTQQI